MVSDKRYIKLSPEQLKSAVWCKELEDICAETKSEIILEEDDSSVQMKIACNGNIWFRYRLRDRSFDGPGWKATPLIDWDYDGKRDIFTLGPAIEESVYCLDPRFSVNDLFSDDISDFIKNPFEALPFGEPTREKLEGWLRKWKVVMDSENIIYPGYFFARNIPKTRKKILAGICKLLKASGYEYLTAVPTWWHVASMCEFLGFEYVFSDDKEKMEELGKMLSSFEDGSERGRRMVAWIVMLQFFAELCEKSGYLPESFDLKSEYILRSSDGGIITFPLAPNKNLWLLYRL